MRIGLFGFDFVFPEILDSLVMIWSVLNMIKLNMSFFYGSLINKVGIESELFCVFDIELSLLPIELKVEIGLGLN